ncbi:RNA-binding (RRM/RBD/RNP motifs) family protein [Euphorbia peplus]|nr:RNA-binding (RRM/RBD/RNP motifs) family protein [Euphorbia peplus]
MATNPYGLVSINSISVRLLIPNKYGNGDPHFSYLPNSYSLAFPNLTLSQRGDVFSAFAHKKLGNSVLELEDQDEDEDEMDDDVDDEFMDDNDDGDVDDDEDEEMLPLGNMRKWLQNKPSGFGVGKAYDTSIEDKLLDEIEQSRKAQAANVDNLKKNPVHPKADKKKATEVLPSGIRVRIANLPKKKNIHRDLQSTFKEVPGIVNIVPAVTGNKKTKDPICKGFAFVDFKSEEHANRFVQQFSGQDLPFGRVQKRIKCSMTNSHSNTSDDESASNDSVSTLTNFDLEEDSNASFSTGDVFSEEGTDELVTEKSQDVTESAESVNDKRMEPMVKPTTGSVTLKKDNNQAVKKKKAKKVKEQKVPKLDIPGSAKRLKVKEKGVLVEVFAKYGSQSQSTLVSGEER